MENERWRRRHVKFEDESGSMSPMIAEASRWLHPTMRMASDGLRIAGHSVWRCTMKQCDAPQL